MTSKAAEAVAAIQSGDVERLRVLLAENPDLVLGRSDGARTLLHVATEARTFSQPNKPRSRS